MRRVDETAIAFGRACDDAGIAYSLIGAVAVLAWGQPRATADVDALVILAPGDVPRFARALVAAGFEVAERDLLDACHDGSHVTAFDPASRFHVDLRRTRDETERRQVEEAMTVAFEGALLRVSRPEETVAFKLKYGSAQDLADARSIVLRQGARLDLVRLRRLAKTLGVTSGLESLLRDERG